MAGDAGSQLRGKFLNGNACLPENTGECAGLDLAVVSMALQRSEAPVQEESACRPRLLEATAMALVNR